MILAKSEIIREIEQGNIIAKNPDGKDIDYKYIKNCSIDVSLGEHMFVGSDLNYRNLKKGCEFETWDFVLAHTDEFVGTRAGSGILPTFKLKSTAGRLGIIHTLAGHGDVGFFGRWAMEFVLSKEIQLKYGDLIGQIYFTKVVGDPDDYAKTGTYQKSSDVKEVISSWTKESILPPKGLKNKF